MTGSLSASKTRLRQALGLTAAAVTAMLGTVASPAAASGTSIASLDGAWLCSVPSGYTYDAVQRTLGQCSSSGFTTIYRVRIPADNLWACSTVPGMTYDSVKNTLNQCSASTFAASYHLRTPTNGLWACTVPWGWTFDATQNTLNQCAISGFATSYHLRG